MSGNYEGPSRNFGDSSQLTNWILDSGTTCHMKPGGKTKRASTNKNVQQ